MKIGIIAIGKLRGAEAEWCGEYIKRLKDGVSVREFSASKAAKPTEAQKAESDFILKNLPPKALAVLLDERGKDMPSREFASKLAGWIEGGREIAFVIGGADGVTDAVKKRADVTLGFGRATWPHRLVRVMLLEQIYRATMINAGHPYHRD